MGVAVETGDTEADGELKPMGKLILVISVIYIAGIRTVGVWAVGACACYELYALVLVENPFP